MTYQEMLTAIPRLSVQERLALLEALSRSLREELHLPHGTSGSAERLLGIIKTAGPPPDDAAVEQIRHDYLAEKYG
jgi:hypothetical protein